jgi:predicted dehydrogenase
LIRLGLIGAGGWGQNYIETIGTLPDVSLAAVVTRDWRPLLAPGLIDGAIIATPPATHAQMVEAAIRAGLPCMVEKPLTTNLAEALSLQSIAGKALILVDHTQLFNPGYIALKAAAAKLGPVRSIESEAGNYGPFRPDYNALWDYAPHDLSMCLDLLGTRPVRVDLKGEYKLSLEFPGNVTASIHVSNQRREKVRRFTVIFDTDTLVFDDLAPSKLANAAGVALPVSGNLPLTRAVETFVAGIRGGSREMFGLDLAVEVVRILDSARL